MLWKRDIGTRSHVMQPIEFEEFLRRTEFPKDMVRFGAHARIERIVSLREMTCIETVQAMPREYLSGLLMHVGLAGDSDKKVFAGCAIHTVRMDPCAVVIGQKFVYRDKYVAILENFKDLFSRFSVPRGISKLTAFMVFGRTRDDSYALAHYLPPIVEMHADKYALTDGVHRNFIIKNSGTTIESIVIEGVAVPFPCLVKPWEEIRIAETKPEKQEDRFFDFRPEFFRDLKAIGIDG